MPLGDLISRAVDGAVEGAAGGSFDQMLAQNQSRPEADPTAKGSQDLPPAGIKPLGNGFLTDIPDAAQILAAFRQMTDMPEKSGEQVGAVIPAGVDGGPGREDGPGLVSPEMVIAVPDPQAALSDAVVNLDGEVDTDASVIAALPAMTEAITPPPPTPGGGAAARSNPVEVLQTAAQGAGGADVKALSQVSSGAQTSPLPSSSSQPVFQQVMAAPLADPAVQSVPPISAQSKQLQTLLDPASNLASRDMSAGDAHPGQATVAAAQAAKAMDSQTAVLYLDHKSTPAGGPSVLNALPANPEGLDFAEAAPITADRLSSEGKTGASPQSGVPASADRPQLPAGTVSTPSEPPSSEPIVFKFKINTEAQDTSPASGEKQLAQPNLLRDSAFEPLRDPAASAPTNAAPQVDRPDARPETGRQMPAPSAEQAQTQVLRNALALNMRDAQWGQKLVAQIERMHSDGQARYDISLRPKNLGDIRVHLEFHGDETQVRIVTETASAARVLIGGEDRLSQLLEASGFRLASFASSMGGQAGAGQGQSQFAKRGADPAAVKSKTARPGQQPGAVPSARQSGPQGTINVIA